MHCQYCGSINGEDDHRCLRCGRRIAGFAIAAPTSYIGATALAVSASPEQDRDFAPERAESPEQPALFQQPKTSRLPAQKVIPFEEIQRQAAGRFGNPADVAQPIQQNASAVPRTQARRQPPSSGRPQTSQGNLDLRPNSSHGERLLATGVTAQVSGDGRVAPPMRRVTAGAMDVSMVLIGFAGFAVAAHFAGPLFGATASTGFGVGKTGLITLASSMVLISIFYGLLFAMARRETAGMNWTNLRLVTFDGRPLDTRERAIRFVAAWLSYCSGGLGLLWALADEESLAFHDHISKTYPAEKGTTVKPARPRR